MRSSFLDHVWSPVGAVLLYNDGFKSEDGTGWVIYSRTFETRRALPRGYFIFTKGLTAILKAARSIAEYGRSVQ